MDLPQSLNGKAERILDSIIKDQGTSDLQLPAHQEGYPY
jgi:hypothetical protein